MCAYFIILFLNVSNDFILLLLILIITLMVLKSFVFKLLKYFEMVFNSILFFTKIIFLYDIGKISIYYLIVLLFL